jgi:hypothetical protein
VIVLRVILGGILGLIVGTIGAGVAFGHDTGDIAMSFAPFGALLGMSLGGTWQILRSDKKR